MKSKAGRLLFYFVSVSFLLLSTGCFSPDLGDFHTLTVQEDKHPFKPYDPTWNDNRLVSYEYQFTTDFIYQVRDDLGRPDTINQCDWLKLGGFSFHKVGNHKNSAMVAFRYDIAGYLLFGPYYHEEGETIRPRCSCSTPSRIFDEPNWSSEGIKASPTDMILVEWVVNENTDYTSVRVTNLNTGDSFFWENYWEKNIRNTREIYPWFGGTRPAPHKITLGRRLILLE